MTTSTNRKLLDADAMAKILRWHPETLRRKLRQPDNEIPFVRDGREYKFDPMAVYEHFIKKDMLNTLDGYLADPKLPAVIGEAIAGLRDGLADGSLSIEKVGELWHQMQA